VLLFSDIPEIATEITAKHADVVHSDVQGLKKFFVSTYAK
jgi:hypothetical protein